MHSPEHTHTHTSHAIFFVGVFFTGHSVLSYVGDAFECYEFKAFCLELLEVILSSVILVHELDHVFSFIRRV